MTRKGFLQLSTGALIAGAMPAVVGAAQSDTAPKLWTRGSPRRTLIRGADLLTMDAKHGELLSGDVLIENGRIAAVGQRLRADADVIDAAGMILMPGMIEGHRHVWESILNGELVKSSRKYATYLQYNNQRVGVCFEPADVYLGNYIGGLAAIDCGVTSMVDQAHVIHTPEKGDAAARGLKDSGIAGVFCYQITHTPSYGPGDTVSAKKAAYEFSAGPDEWHLKHAAEIRAKYFSDSDGLLRFGVGLSTAIGDAHPRTLASIKDEVVRARELAPLLMTQHSSPIAYFAGAGLLGPDIHVSHGNTLTDDELKMMRDAGGSLCATTMGEFPYAAPSIHARARIVGVPVGIGLDVPFAFTNDFFEHTRSAFWSLYRSPEGARLASTFESHDVLAFATSEGARAIKLGDVTGTITVGKRADLVLLRTDRFGFPETGTLADRVVNFAHREDIDSVWVAGSLRKKGGRMLGVDWAALKREARAAQLRIWERAETIRFVD